MARLRGKANRHDRPAGHELQVSSVSSAARPPGGPVVLHPGDASHDVGTAWRVVRRVSMNGHRRV